MSLLQHDIVVETTGQGLYEVTAPIAGWVAGQGVRQGLLNIFIQHSSASLVIQENADPDVRRDLADFFSRLVPEDDGLYRHDAEGPDDMPAHIRSALTQTQLGIPVTGGRLALGTWQGIYLFEHRRAPHRRSLVLTLIGA
jgi:secondary thiamine-phosphate synthase enzyme